MQPVLLITLLLAGGITSGFNVPRWILWIRYTSFSYFSSEVLLWNEFKGTSIGTLTGEQFIRQRGFGNVRLSSALLYLFIYAIMFTMLGLILLKVTTRLNARSQE